VPVGAKADISTSGVRKDEKSDSPSLGFGKIHQPRLPSKTGRREKAKTHERGKDGDGSKSTNPISRTADCKPS